MSTLINNDYIEEKLLAERQASGLDTYDEVWDGVYFMAPDPDLQHQKVVTKLSTLLDIIASIELKGEVFTGCNVSDRDIGWRQNYRRPDIAVYLPGTKAIFHHAHTQGGPDFAVEVCSPKDRTWDKLDFYAEVSTRELLIIDRNPWVITLLRLGEGQLREVGASSLGSRATFASEAIPLSFQLTAGGNGEPEIVVKHTSDERIWHVPVIGPQLNP